jgi:hypothetical protein
MNKDVIYIDVEDDITAIISKVKASKEKIVALVPPKRIGVLQSAVNLRLLSRAADQGSKRLVLITNNHALMSLAASAGLPVAKNLQSKPELAPISAIEVDDGEDIIDGNDLPVGEHAGMMKEDEAVEAIAAAPVISSATLAPPPKPGESMRKAKSKSGSKVPNFNTFRKKLILGIGIGVLLISFLVWAIFFAPRATVIVKAKTNDTSINANVTALETAKTDQTKGTVKAVVVKESEEKSVDFTATGSKNVGEKATGTVEFSTESISSLGTTIPAGTRLTTEDGLVFVTDSTVTITLENYQGAPTGVTATEQGAKYNAATGSMSGAPSGVSAELTDATSGGTDKIVKVVTAGDIQKAKEQLVKQESDSMKDQLKAGFKDEVKIIDESFTVDYTGVESTPAVGQEAASGSGSLTTTVTYKLYAVEMGELEKYLDAYLKEELKDRKDQRVYDDGAKDAKFQEVDQTKGGAKFTLIATAKVGPKLNEDQIKEEARGRKFGEIQASIQNIQGVEDVDIKFFPFWVSTVPDDLKKITVKFEVNE